MSHLDVTLDGNLIADPSYKSFGSGAEVARFRMAASRSRRVGGKDGGEKDVWEDVDQLYIDVECWGTLARNVQLSLRKGSPVVACGKLVTEVWVQKQEKEGEYGTSETETVNRSKIMLKANKVAYEMSNHYVTPMRGVEVNARAAEPDSVADAVDQSFDDPPEDQALPATGTDGAPAEDTTTQDTEKELVGVASGDAGAPF